MLGFSVDLFQFDLMLFVSSGVRFPKAYYNIRPKSSSELQPEDWKRPTKGWSSPGLGIHTCNLACCAACVFVGRLELFISRQCTTHSSYVRLATGSSILVGAIFLPSHRACTFISKSCKPATYICLPLFYHGAEHVPQFVFLGCG